jgi:hypothetical protein
MFPLSHVPNQPGSVQISKQPGDIQAERKTPMSQMSPLSRFPIPIAQATFSSLRDGIHIINTIPVPYPNHSQL